MTLNIKYDQNLTVRITTLSIAALHITDKHHTNTQLKIPSIMTLRMTAFSIMTPALSVSILSLAFFIVTTSVVMLSVVTPPLSPR